MVSLAILIIKFLTALTFVTGQLPSGVAWFTSLQSSLSLIHCQRLKYCLVTVKLISCYHPKYVRNKYTGEYIVARCGKCPACLNSRSAQWVTRLDLEMQSHLYTFFATLQFDEQHVKQLVLLDKCDRPSDLPAYIDISSGQIFDLSSVSYTLADIHYCENTKFLLVHDVSLVQLFIKRLRKYIYEHFPNEHLRYFIALEYGPSTFRPHCHSLFFFDSALLAKDFAELLSSSWQYGNVFDAHPVAGSASQYVASYVNCTANLPAIYLHKDLRQKSLFSKCPPIGSYSWTEQTFKRFFDSDASTFTVFRQGFHEFCDVPLFRSVQNRIFPKIVGFDRLSHYDRVALYELGFKFIETCPVIGEIFDCSSRKLSEINVMYLFNWLNRPLWHPYLELFKTPNKRAHSKLYGFNEYSLSRFVSSVGRVCRNCLTWNVSLDFYVSKIENYYESLEKANLRDFYYAQDEYFKSHPLSDFLRLHPHFCYSVANRLPSSLSKWQRVYLETYMPELLVSDKPIFINYKDCSAYRSLVGLHDKISFDNTKQKKANDYLLAHKDKFNNIITYNQEIQNYVKSKTF